MDKYAITLDTYNKSARQYQDKFMNLDLYNDGYDRFCTLLGKDNASVLDIACGPGNITRYVLSVHPHYQMMGIDLAPHMIELAAINNPSAYFAVMDCRDISSIEKTFNGILCGFCMPYLSEDECDRLIGDMHGLLHSNGVIYFSAMEGDSSRSGFETTSFSGENKVFIHYHLAAFLLKSLEKHHFMLIDLHRQQYPEANGTFSTDMIFIARKV